jgi:hypothetical protein
MLISMGLISRIERRFYQRAHDVRVRYVRLLGPGVGA